MHNIASFQLAEMRHSGGAGGVVPHSSGEHETILLSVAVWFVRSPGVEASERVAVVPLPRALGPEEE